MLWVHKRTISMRRFFWAPKTYVKTDGRNYVQFYAIITMVYIVIFSSNDFGTYRILVNLLFTSVWEEWLSGRVLNFGLQGHLIESHQRQCILSLSKTLYTLLSTGSTQEDRKSSWYDWKIVCINTNKQTNKCELLLQGKILVLAFHILCGGIKGSWQDCAVAL